jgi:subtilisin-like proprotein convertase family protein
VALVQPEPTPGIDAPELDSYNYGATSTYGSNVLSAWRYATGVGVLVALIDDGFDPVITGMFGSFDAIDSANFGIGDPTDINEPSGGYHGTTTSGLIGDSGEGGEPVGIAPNATIVGVKVTFGNVSFDTFVEALSYASTVASVINNSWVFSGFGVGEPTDPFFASWYAAIQAAVQSGRGGLGDVIVFAAGNDRTAANDVGLQPINSDPRVIAAAASDEDGSIAAYSNRGAGLLVTAIGDSVAVPYPGGEFYAIASGTSYAAPTISAISALMLSVNPNLGWRDVQEILADSAYAPPPSISGFVVNAAGDWNGGGRQFSDDFGFGVVDADVAVNLARAWTEQSTDSNLATASGFQLSGLDVEPDTTVTSSLTIGADERVQHVQVEIADVNLLAAGTELILTSPSGTQSVLLDQAGVSGGVDQTGGLDLSGSMITDNAFWGESAQGTWTLSVSNVGVSDGTLQGWMLKVWGDDATTVASPLVYTPEFAGLAASDGSRTVVSNAGTNTDTIDLISLPATTQINLNGGAGLIDGVAVNVLPGLSNANADGSTGSVTLIGAAGGSMLTGGDGPTTIDGQGGDTIVAGLGPTMINTGTGGSSVTLNDTVASSVASSVTSGGNDTIMAGSGTVSITVSATIGDVIYAQASRLSFIGGSGASIVYAGTGSVQVQAGAGGGTFYAGHAGGSVLTAGSGLVVLFGAANGDVLTASGNANDTLIAGAGNEILFGGSATGSITLVGGSGIDSMTAGLGHTTFVAGSGNDMMTIGGIADLITLRDGRAGGLDTIEGFRIGTDALHLIGYANGAANAALSVQTSDGSGGSLLQLADGTRIDLVGIAHATAGMFA